MAPCLGAEPASTWDAAAGEERKVESAPGAATCVESIFLLAGAADAPTVEGEGTAAGSTSVFWPAWAVGGLGFSVFTFCCAALAASLVAGFGSAFGLAASAASVFTLESTSDANASAWQ